MAISHLTRVEPSTVSEWIAGIPRRARANGHVVSGVAVGVEAADVVARVDAPLVLALLMAAALGVVQALGTATEREWVADVAPEAGADRTAADDRALGVLATGGAATARHIGGD